MMDRADEPCNVIYAGAASGSHILCLLQLFPCIHWHLWDPASFDHQLAKHARRPASRISIYTGRQGKFTNDVAASYTQGGALELTLRPGPVYFISDVRTTVPGKPRLNQFTHEVSTTPVQDIEGDMQKQLVWARSIQADGTMFKFKLPFPQEGHSAFFKYCAGTPYFQCWARVPSAETRLIATQQQLNVDVNYNIPLFCGKVDYMNTFMRTTDYRQTALRVMGINCSSANATLGAIWYDCKLPRIAMDAYIETLTWALYLQRLPDKLVTTDLIRWLVKCTTLNLTRSIDRGESQMATLFQRYLNYYKFGDSAVNFNRPANLDQVAYIRANR
jgi:hypothetical protein